MILAGDIGGTKTVLSLWRREIGGTVACHREQAFSSPAYPAFDAIIDEFLPPGTELEAACFGVAGPIIDQRCQTTNLPWLLDAGALRQKLQTSQVRLLNDLEAMALGMLHLPEQDLLELNPNAEPRVGNCAVIAAGTGLGEAILYWDGRNYRPLATEGGHSDFAAQTPQQDRLLAYLRGLYPDHVSYERILSGVGFSHLYEFLCSEQGVAAGWASNDGEDRNALISKAGINGDDALCGQAVRLFAQLYGAEAGNLALKSLATGGVFIGGGIAAKILPAMQDGEFLRAFKSKGRFYPMLDRVPVRLSLNPRTALIGAIHYFAGG